MCGIAGICNYGSGSIENIQAMNQAIIHRGSDAGGYWLDENAQIIYYNDL